MVAAALEYANSVDPNDALDELTRERLKWRRIARPNQLPPPGDWRTWLVMAGRGFGKTRTGAEWVLENVRAGRARRVALVAATNADVRDIMVEGESGLLAVCERAGWAALYEPSKRKLTFLNGAIAKTYSAEEPKRLRGPQQDLAWSDELAAWDRMQETWDNLQFGLRLGVDPRQIATTTPRPVKLVRELVKDANTVVTRGSTYENRDNLAPAFLSQVVTRYEGTRQGRQELGGELLDDYEGALWTREWFDAGRVASTPAEMERIVVAVDPAVTSTKRSDETGICVAGRGYDGHDYVIESLGLRVSPNTWATEVVRLYDKYRADVIVAEVNNGGEMVTNTIRTVWDDAPVTIVHATRGKALRADPVASRYEQGRVHHVGAHDELEDQMVALGVEEGNDDRVDAAVYALTELDNGGGMPLLVW